MSRTYFSISLVVCDLGKKWNQNKNGQLCTVKRVNSRAAYDDNIIRHTCDTRKQTIDRKNPGDDLIKYKLKCCNICSVRVAVIAIAVQRAAELEQFDFRFWMKSLAEPNNLQHESCVSFHAKMLDKLKRNNWKIRVINSVVDVVFSLHAFAISFQSTDGQNELQKWKKPRRNSQMRMNRNVINFASRENSETNVRCTSVRMFTCFYSREILVWSVRLSVECRHTHSQSQ